MNICSGTPTAKAARNANRMSIPIHWTKAPGLSLGYGEMGTALLAQSCSFLYPERGLNPHGRNGHRIFLPATAFAAPDGQCQDLWSGLSLRPALEKRVGASRQVSTPSPAKAGAWLGITIPIKEKASPNLRSSTSGVSAGALKLL